MGFAGLVVLFGVMACATEAPTTVEASTTASSEATREVDAPAPTEEPAATATPTEVPTATPEPQSHTPTPSPEEARTDAQRRADDCGLKASRIATELNFSFSVICAKAIREGVSDSRLDSWLADEVENVGAMIAKGLDMHECQTPGIHRHRPVELWWETAALCYRIYFAEP